MLEPSVPSGEVKRGTPFRVSGFNKTTAEGTHPVTEVAVQALPARCPIVSMAPTPQAFLHVRSFQDTSQRRQRSSLGCEVECILASAIRTVQISAFIDKYLNGFCVLPKRGPAERRAAE